MNITSCSILVSAPRADVFEFLADMDSMPEWATEFCQSTERTPEGWVVQTEHGLLCADVTADLQTGVIDMRAGPTRDHMALFPIRVQSIPGGRTLVTFTFIQEPNLPDEDFAIQYQSLQIELEGLADRFDGAVHAPLSAFNASAIAA